MNNLLDSLDLNVELNDDIFDLAPVSLGLLGNNDLNLELVATEESTEVSSCAKAVYNLGNTLSTYDWS